MPAKVELIPLLPGLSPVGGKPVIARFDGGQLSSDGGLLVLREVEQRLDVAARLAELCWNLGDAVIRRRSVLACR